jgi:Ca2+/Na+ antiporter
MKMFHWMFFFNRFNMISFFTNLWIHLGAGIFVTTVVVAVVSLVGDPSFLKYSFLRDVLFYFGGVLGASLLINDGYITLWKALLLLGYYLLYPNTKTILFFCFYIYEFQTIRFKRL